MKAYRVYEDSYYTHVEIVDRKNRRDCEDGVYTTFKEAKREALKYMRHTRDEFNEAMANLRKQVVID